MPTEHLKTIGQVAERIAQIDGVYSAGYVARQIRTLVQRGNFHFLRHIGEGRTAAAAFDEAEMCKARLLTVLMQLGLPEHHVTGAANCMKNLAMDDATAMAGKLRRDGLHTAVEGIKNGDDWYFKLYVKTLAAEHDDEEDDAGAGIIGGCFSRDARPDHPFEAIIRCSIILPCKTLLHRLVAPQ